MVKWQMRMVFLESSILASLTKISTQGCRALEKCCRVHGCSGAASTQTINTFSTKYNAIVEWNLLLSKVVHFQIDLGGIILTRRFRSYHVRTRLNQYEIVLIVCVKLWTAFLSLMAAPGVDWCVGTYSTK